MLRGCKADLVLAKDADQGPDSGNLSFTLPDMRKLLGWVKGIVAELLVCGSLSSNSEIQFLALLVTNILTTGSAEVGHHCINR